MSLSCWPFSIGDQLRGIRPFPYLRKKTCPPCQRQQSIKSRGRCNPFLSVSVNPPMIPPPSSSLALPVPTHRLVLVFGRREPGKSKLLQRCHAHWYQQ